MEVGLVRGRFVEMRLPADPSAPSRQGRVAQRVRAFVPDALEGLDVSLSGAQAADLADAEAALARLRHVAAATPVLDAAAWRLLRAEAVASSQIEAVEITHRRLARAEAGADAATGRRHADAAETLANVEAMRAAARQAAGGIRVDDLLEWHRLLLRGSARAVDRELAGRWRDRPVWIGGASVLSAAYVAPPHGEVPRLIDDLVAFVGTRRDLSPVLVAGIAHAQFETIHPFHDGNGRVGRCLVHAVLRAHGATGAAVAPVSLPLRADIDSYIDGLVAFRHGDVAGWAAQFAVAVTRACTAAMRLADGLRQLRDEWLARLGAARGADGRRALRADAAVVRLLDELPAMPVLTVAMVAERLEVSTQAANTAVTQLRDAGILRQVSVSRRSHVHEAGEVFELLGSVEAAITTTPITATAAGDERR